MDELKLIKKCVKGDAKAFNEFIALYSDFIKGVIRKTLSRIPEKNSGDIEKDIYQEILFALTENDFALLDSFKGKCKVTTWLWTVIRRKTFRHLDKLPVFSSLDPEMRSLTNKKNGVLEKLEKKELTRLVDEAIEGLKEEEQMVIHLFYLSDLSYKEISKKTGIPEGNLSNVISRAKQKLAEKLSKAL